jgi:hypothetical protein
MSKILDFNSLWQIAFAVNAIFVYFELAPALERKFKGVNAVGKSVIDDFIEDKDRRYINNYGWKSILFNFTNWIWKLKLLSIINSIVALLLIIIAGFSPEAELGWYFLGVIILILFTPIIAIPGIIRYVFPIYKLKCIEEAIKNILDRDGEKSELISQNSRRYKIAIEYIKVAEFGPSFFVKRNKEFSNEEVFREFEQLND